MKNIYPPREFGKLIGRSVITLRKWDRKGIVKAHRSLTNRRYLQAIGVFSSDAAKSVNRKLTLWMEGIIQDRAEFKALEGGSLHKQVNPAWGSQTCPVCDFLWPYNRKGDRFKCLMCGHEAPSDEVAAINYLHRADDAEITRFMPYGLVREVLMERFLRRLECDGFLVLPPGLNPETMAYLKREWEALCRKSVARKPERTVPGRTADTGQPYGQSAVGDESPTAGGLRPLSLRRSIAERNLPPSQRWEHVQGSSLHLNTFFGTAA